MRECSGTSRLQIRAISIHSITFIQDRYIPLGPLISAAYLGISFPRVRTRDLGRSTSLNDTSGGMEIAAPPTRDCAGDVVEKARGENAGARKMGNELRWEASRSSCRAQRWGIEADMVARCSGAALRTFSILLRMAFAR